MQLEVAALGSAPEERGAALGARHLRAKSQCEVCSSAQRRLQSSTNMNLSYNTVCCSLLVAFFVRNEDKGSSEIRGNGRMRGKEERRRAPSLRLSSFTATSPLLYSHLISSYRKSARTHEQRAVGEEQTCVERVDGGHVGVAERAQHVPVVAHRAARLAGR